MYISMCFLDVKDVKFEIDTADTRVFLSVSVLYMLTTSTSDIA